MLTGICKGLDILFAVKDIYDLIQGFLDINNIDIYEPAQLLDSPYESNYYISKEEQLQNYSGLIKTAINGITSNKQNQMHFGRISEGDFVEAIFDINKTENWYTQVRRELALNASDSYSTDKLVSSYSSVDYIGQIKTDAVSFDETTNFHMIAKGVAEFEFDANYASDYSIYVPNLNKMKILIDNKEYATSSNTLNVKLSAGIHNIEIREKCGDLIDSSICIKPVEISNTGTKELSLNGNEDYLLKIKSLSSVKKLTTMYPGVIINKIYDSSWNEYDYYGKIIPAAEITKPFKPGDYYVEIHNSYSYPIADTFRVLEPNELKISKETSIYSAYASTSNYRYLKFSGSKGQYVITDSYNDWSDIIVLDGPNLIPSTNYTDYVEFSLSSNKTIYIGVKVNDSQDKITIKTKASSYYVVATTAKNKNAPPTIYHGGYIELYRGEICTFALYLAGVKQDVDVNFGTKGTQTQNGTYSYTFRNKLFEFKKDSMVGGSGVMIDVGIKDDLLMYFYVIPKYDDVATDVFVSLYSADTIYFTYIVPKYTIGIGYIIHSSVTNSSDDRVSEIPIESESGSINILSDISSNVLYQAADIYIEIVKIKYMDAGRNGHYAPAKAISNSVNTMFAGGKGTSTNPFLIMNSRQFENITIYDKNHSDIYYKLNWNITLNNWTKYGDLKGHFNGDNRTLTVYINAANKFSGDIGLFNNNYGDISELNLKVQLKLNTSMGSWQSVGGICATNKGTIKNCSVSGVNTNYMYNGVTYNVAFVVVGKSTFAVGGITGCNEGTIESCTSYVDILTTGETGGIAGMCHGEIYYSDYGSRLGKKPNIYWYYIDENRCIGGIAGYQSKGTIKSSYNYGVISYEGPESANRNIKPRMGLIVGHKRGNVEGYNSDGKIETNNLEEYNKQVLFWFVFDYSQKEYAQGGPFGLEQ